MMKQSVCRILLVEDEPGDANLVRQALRSSTIFDSELTWVCSLTEAQSQCNQQLPDLLLLDLSLPDSKGLDTLLACRKKLGFLPIIVLTGYDDSDFAIQALDHGAQDYLFKGSFDGDSLVRAIRYAISRTRLEARLYDSEARMALALEGAKLGLWDMYRDGEKMIFNDYWAEMLGYAHDELEPCLGILERLVHPADWARVKDTFLAHLAGHSTHYESEYRMRHKNGHWVWIYSSGRAMERDREGRALRVVGIHQDISTRKAAEARDRLLVAALEAVSLGVVITDTESRIEWANPAFTSLTGYSFAEAKGRKPAELVKSGLQGVTFYEAMWQVINRDQSWRGELINRRKNGDLYHEELTIASVPDENGMVQHFIGVKQDISERKRMESELLEMATTDPLTSLYNRRYFMARLEEELCRMRRHHEHQVSLLMLDLDHFKRINDQYGHAVGDAMLQHVADLMREDVRNIDMIGRLGGEEFAILMTDTESIAAGLFAERIRQQLEKTPLPMDEKCLAITVSIGVASMNANDAAADNVLIRADQALYRSKEGGRNQVQIYSELKPSRE